MAFRILGSLAEGLRYVFWLFDRHSAGMLDSVCVLVLILRSL